MIKSILFTFFAFTVLLIACSNGDVADTAGSPTDTPKSRGEMVFDIHCTLCHGADGRLGIGNAKDLSTSALSRDEMMLVVANGRGTMMPYRHVLSTSEIEAVVDHVRTLGVGE